MNLLLLILAILLPFAPAQGKQMYIVHDSIYYTMDDGIQTPKEMEEEAQYVYEMCQRNNYEATYFDCACLSGAFLQTREKMGPTVLQNDIMKDLTKSSRAICANKAAIAGQAYQDCITYSDGAYELAKDNEDYCTCTANKTAQEFAKYPRLNIQYIRSVKLRAMDYCSVPANRPSAKPKTNQ